MGRLGGVCSLRRISISILESLVLIRTGQSLALNGSLPGGARIQIASKKDGSKSECKELLLSPGVGVLWAVEEGAWEVSSLGTTQVLPLFLALKIQPSEGSSFGLPWALVSFVPDPGLVNGFSLASFVVVWPSA
ncbi:unnamed protein product [Sphagnum balticum]